MLFSPTNERLAGNEAVQSTAKNKTGSDVAAVPTSCVFPSLYCFLCTTRQKWCFSLTVSGKRMEAVVQERVARSVVGCMCVCVCVRAPVVVCVWFIQ